MRLPLAALFSLLPVILATPIKERSLAPLMSSGETIQDSYIVVFKDGVTPEQIALHLNSVSDWNQASVSTPPESMCLATRASSAGAAR
jgi:cerevisin